jgi:hypothetical protein
VQKAPIRLATSATLPAHSAVYLAKSRIDLRKQYPVIGMLKVKYLNFSKNLQQFGTKFVL